MTKDTDGKPMCSVCNTNFSNSANLRGHVEAHHYSPGYACPTCFKVYKLRKSFTHHVKTYKHATLKQIRDYLSLRPYSD